MTRSLISSFSSQVLSKISEYVGTKMALHNQIWRRGSFRAAIEFAVVLLEQ